jgi:uncharacterized protein (TIGR03067 family)
MKSDIRLLQGTWKIDSLELDGAAMPSGEASITVKGGRFTTTAMGAEYSGRIEVRQSRFPKQFDLHFDAGPETANTSYGIYELDGDTWKICMTLRGGTRPVTFATKAGSGLALETLKRADPPKPDAAPAELAGEPAPELAGEWTMVSAIMSGRALEERWVKMGKRIATANTLEVKVGPQTILKAAYAVDRSKTPLEMNYLLADGRVQAGIWELEGTRLKTCFGGPGNARPAEFASIADDGRTFTVWTK